MKPDERKCPQCAEAIKIDARICKHCGHVMSDGEIAAGKAAKRRELWQGGIGCLVLVILAGLAVAMCSGGESPPPKTPQEVDPLIKAATYMGPNLNIDMDLGATGDLPVERAGEAVEKLGKALKSGMPGPTAETKYVQVVVRGPTLGRLGEEDTSKYFQMRFSVSDLRRANYDNLTWFDILNLADEIYIARVADPAVAQFCTSYADGARNFCRQAL
ncbi:zinc ribbon domain-containing protein [Sphingomonas sp. R647]|uniref:zinc ribbon domain-containing protein n=1 Tax=Sphingomonas sp. R647 TaxID=2875233 RepID=UPI001CD405D0|nr:zinc ribbon domain-containing protein [Sphingomonas sp. R647]MCA1199158.1 zinc ribbon domain-containing protein [Sphingomonas sp. R647]